MVTLTLDKSDAEELMRMIQYPIRDEMTNTKESEIRKKIFQSLWESGVRP